MSDYIVAGSLDDVPDGSAITIQHKHDYIAVFNCAGTFYATANGCPHAHGPLSQGAVEDGIVTCPWHGYTFDLGTGTCLSPSTAQCRLGAIPTVTEEDGQLVASTA